MVEHQRDYNLCQLMISGDEQAADKFVSENYEKVRFFISSKVFKDIPFREDLIWDVTQEVFIRVLTDLRKFNGKSSLYTWICGYALKSLSEKLKENDKHRHLSLLDTDKADELNEESLFGNVYRCTPEEIYILKEEHDNIQEILSELPQNYRTILTRRLWEDKSIKEISEITKKSVAAVDSELRRAIIEFVASFKNKYLKAN